MAENNNTPIYRVREVTIAKDAISRYVEEYNKLRHQVAFTLVADNAQTFPTYSKANTLARKVNTYFGYKRVKVETIK